MIGETTGGYRLVQKLGEGSMGEVFLGEHGQSGQKAAVKVLFPNFSKEGTALTRYFAEVRSTNLFGHPGIAQVYDCGIHTSGRAYLCMEYLPGKSLAAALGDMDNVGEIATLANIGGQVAGALQVVHGKRMIHRALKADSIFMTSPAPYPVIKLLDFGVANFTQNVRHSQTGSLLGAPLYMSPEVGRGLGNVDHRADIYSLGCILFEMATGRPPFVREGAGQLIIAHATEAAPAARTLEPSIPPELDDLIARSLRKDPAQRPQTMTEVAALLARFSKSAAAAPAPALMSAFSFPQQVVAVPQASTPALPAQSAAAPRASAPPIPVQAPSVQAPSAQAPSVQAPSVVPSATNASRPQQRKPEPTALLQAPVQESHAPVAALPSKHPTQKNPVARPQPTVLLDPPSSSPWWKSDRAGRSGFGPDARSSEAQNTRGIQASGDAADGPESARTATWRLSPRAAGPIVTREASPKRTSRSGPAQVGKTAPSSRLLSPPLVAIGGCIVLCVVAIVVLLLVKKSPAPKTGRTSPVPSRASAPAREEFKPPSPELLPPAETPSAPDAKSVRVAPGRAQPTRPAGKTKMHPEPPNSHPSLGKAGKQTGEKATPAKSKETRRW